MLCKKQSLACRMVFGVVFFLICFIGYRMSEELSHYSFYTGWSMLLMMFFLASYNLRKKLTTLPLGKVAVWMRFHVYTGILMAPAYLFHTSFSWPNGQLEIVLAIIFAIVFFTGVIGLAITKIFPKLLSRQNEEFIYERIPALRYDLQESLQEEILEDLKASQSRTLADFYKTYVHSYMGSNYFLYSFYKSRLAVNKIRKKMSSLERYLDDEEMACLNKMRDFVNKKAELDYSYCLQFCLKYWLFIHIPFTWSLLVFSLYHVYIVYLFTGART